MRVIDDEGRLFGAVNVIDALVALVLLAVVAAGAALVLQPSGPTGQPTGDDGPDEPEQRSVAGEVTLDLGKLPPHVASAIAEGDELNVTDSNATVTLTDVYLSPTGGGVAMRIAGRLEANTTLDAQDGLAIGERRIALSDGMNLRGYGYAVKGRIVGFDGTGEAFDATWRTVTVRWSSADADVAERLAVGDEEQIAGRTTARVAEVETEPTTTTTYEDGEPVQRRRPGLVDATVTLAVRTLETSSGPTYHGKRLSANRNVALDLGDVRVKGVLVDVGAVGSASP